MSVFVLLNFGMAFAMNIELHCRGADLGNEEKGQSNRLRIPQRPKSNAKINSSSTYLIVVLVMTLVHLEMLLAVLVMMSAVRLADDHQN